MADAERPTRQLLPRSERQASILQAAAAAFARTGFASNRSWQVGTSGTPVLLEEYEYEDTTTYFKRSINSGESYVYRPILKDILRYPSEDDQDPGDEETTTADAAESSAALAIESIVTSNPKVVTAENGSDSVTTRTQYFRDEALVGVLRPEPVEHVLRGRCATLHVTRHRMGRFQHPVGCVPGELG